MPRGEGGVCPLGLALGSTSLLLPVAAQVRGCCGGWDVHQGQPVGVPQPRGRSQEGPVAGAAGWGWAEGNQPRAGWRGP